MASRWQNMLQAVGVFRRAVVQGLRGLISGILMGVGQVRSLILGGLALAALCYGLYRHPPVVMLAHGEIGIRSNALSAGYTEVREGPVLVIPGLHHLRRYPLRDQFYKPQGSTRANGPAPFQSMEGLSIGLDITVRYALDTKRIAVIAATLPDDPARELVEPAVQGIAYRTLTRYTVKEIFSTKRAEIQQSIEAELAPKLAADGLLLRSVQIGNIDLPADYRAGMEKLLAEELETEKMHYTLQLKDQQVKQSALEAEAEKVRREKEAEAAGNEQIIAARAQEEAMKHVIPFKQRQIEQRQLEAEAQKASLIKTAEGTAEARRIEAAGEADSRQKLADAEAYRLERIGKIESAQMERDGELLSRHPLLIQKTMADKLSDKVSVIIAAPPANGGFIGASLLGQTKPTESQALQAANSENKP